MISHKQVIKRGAKVTYKGIEAVVIGRFTDSNDRIIIKDDETTYLDSPKQEELLIK